MDSIAGVIVLFVIIGLIEKFSKKSKVNRNTNVSSGSQQPPRRVPQAQSFFSEEEEDDAPAPPAVQRPVAVVQPGAHPVEAAQPAPKAPDGVSADALIQRESAAALLRAALEQRKPEGTEEKQSVIEKSIKASGKGKRAKKAGTLRSGESIADAEGCLGGSLGAHAEEGESRAEHAEHVRKRDAALAAEASVARQAAALRSAGTAELRRAVVMAEILDKPVSLRRRA